MRKHHNGFCVLGLSLGLSLGLFQSTAWAQDASELHQQALQAFTQARYAEALRLFKEAYAATSSPAMLVRIGQTHLKLGHKAEALDACLNYLTLSADKPDPMYRGYAEQCVADARVGLVPGPAAVPNRQPAALPQAAATTVAKTPTKTPVVIEEDDPVPKKQVPSVSASARPAVSPGLPPPAVLPPPSAPPPVSLARTTGASLMAVYDHCLQKQRDGHGDAAQQCYEDLVPNALRSSGMQENEIALVLSQLRRYPNPAVAVPWTAQHRVVETRNTGLWVAGLTLWLSALVPAVVMGPLYAENPVFGEHTDAQTHSTIHYTLMAPVVGPFISGIWLPLVSEDRRYAALHYTVPWIVADGLAQLAGVTMLIAGAQKTKYRLSPAASRVVRSLQVAPIKTPELSGLSVVGRF